MPTYTAPVEDMMFLFEKLRNNKNYNEIKKYQEVTPELVKDILEEAAKINQNIILPLAKAGDENPTVLENGVVRTPPGYKEAYNKFIEDGWTSLSCDPKYGGQGMPKTVSAFFDEMLSSASLSFKLYSELSIGAYNCINRHATDSIKDKFLPKMVEGKWSGTMCLTEPVCGTDLGLLKTKAVEQSDGTFKLTGQKIFITSGDHDLTENIIHLVIARASDSPKGTKGISLFLVPKFIVEDDGSIGPRNGISTGSIESKMGIKGSATCVLNFDAAVGYMIGPKNKGLNSMFTMMNLERIVVGIQGLGISEIAYQNSLNYAKERKQGNANNSKPNNAADFIIEHADIRKSLLNMKSIIEGKGILNNRISEHILSSLNQIGIETHLIKRINMREQLVKLVEIIPIEFVVRNIATGSLTKRLGIEEGTVLDKPLIEFCYKNDELNDPLIAREHIYAFGWATPIEINRITDQCLRINDFMQGMFKGVGIKLVDFKLEFGRLNQNGKKKIVLADEISPDTCRLWDVTSEEKLDKDRFRKNLGNLLEAYQEVARRLNILHEETNIRAVKFGKLRSIKNQK